MFWLTAVAYAAAPVAALLLLLGGTIWWLRTTGRGPRA